MNPLRCIYAALASGCAGFLAGWREERSIQYLSAWYESRAKRELADWMPPSGSYSESEYGRRNAGHVS